MGCVALNRRAHRAVGVVLTVHTSRMPCPFPAVRAAQSAWHLLAAAERTEGNMQSRCFLGWLGSRRSDPGSRAGHVLSALLQARDRSVHGANGRRAAVVALSAARRGSVRGSALGEHDDQPEHERHREERSAGEGDERVQHRRHRLALAACGPQCPGGGPAVWTGTAAPSTGGSVNIIASICLQLPYTIVGSWSCSPGTAPCFAAGGTLLGSGVGANFTAHSVVGTGFTDPIWSCDFVGVKTGATLAGNYSCTGHAGMFSGTWHLQRCP